MRMPKIDQSRTTSRILKCAMTEAIRVAPKTVCDPFCPFAYVLLRISGGGLCINMKRIKGKSNWIDCQPF